MSKASREHLRLEFGDRCAYCRSPVGLFPGSGQIDHILPRSIGGSSDDDNLCLCCTWCNVRKGDRIFARDPLDLSKVRLFDPRQQNWDEHFLWSADYARLIGLTPCGRATIDALDLNNIEFIRTRQFWTLAGWHPPVKK